MKNQKKTTFILLAGVIFTIGSLSWKTPSQNVLTNTKWKGILMVPSAEQGVLSFKKDTSLAIINDQIIETGTYQVKGDTLIIKKISGGSPCSDEVGYYKYVIKANKLTITALHDDCTARTNAYSPDGYQKMEN